MSWMLQARDLGLTGLRRRRGEVGMQPEGSGEQAAVGGVETVLSVDGAYYRVHTFSANGTLTVASALANAEYLIVGGGGQGGAGSKTSSIGGGGGAGGYLAGTTSLSPGEYPITVGAGAPGQYNNALDATMPATGGNTVALGLTAYGGGRGGSGDGAGGFAKPGGSGGGASSWNGNGYGSGVSGQGHEGGQGISSSYSGGGGGAGGPGSSAGADAPYGAGPGVTNSITGTAVTYAIGGAGWRRTNGDRVPNDGATPGSGGDGFGRPEAASAMTSGSGADGIVVVRYEITQAEYEAAP